LLVDAGYEASFALDGRAALDTLRQWPADLVLLDLIMPRLDGFGFLSRLPLDAPSTSTPPIIVVWSVAGTQELERARALGASECLPRASIGPDELLRTLERLLVPQQSSQVD
jgi:CheY-like chemotaxis protein